MATNQPGLEPAASHAYPGIEVQPHSAQQQYSYPGSFDEETRQKTFAAQQPSYPAQQQPLPVQQHAYPGYQSEKGTTAYAPTTVPSAFGDDRPPRKRKILGLSVPVFWCLLIALILVLAGGIGGGIGGGLAAQQRPISEKDNVNNGTSADNVTAGSGATGTPTTTTKPTGPISYTSSTVIPTKLPLFEPSLIPTDGGCPTINGSRYTPPDNAGAGEKGAGITLQGQTAAQSFVRLCNTNYSGFKKANPGMVDLLEFFAKTFDSCMTACAEYNRQYQESAKADAKPEGWCKAVSQSLVPGGKCYLKSKDANPPVNTTELFKETLGSTSALLVEGI
ncbi:hypothetical protein PG999_001732 [Apiospora kogelbergensis]|uniref:PAN domain-containing protein n=1 Tax=Apiospora kogelbergensis TaxID=1337665 RepID=A0AAW0R646_9PEZI